jgi:tRNA-(ms[2]io[6]A)-hydroxylase
MHRYSGNLPLLHKMSRLAREELRHFEQVMALMAARGVRYDWVSASRYASGLHALVCSHEPQRLVDTLIAGAFIEARSCERFAWLAPHLDAELSQFYRSLLRSEARHFRDYLALARTAAGGSIDAALARFADREQELIEDPDTELRFHSGPISA